MAAAPRPSWFYLVVGAVSRPLVEAVFRLAEEAARVATDRLADAVHDLERRMA